MLGVFLNGAGVPLSYLHDTPFVSHLVPGLALGIVVGGTQVTAAIAVNRRHPYAIMAAAVAGFGMIVWIFVELAVISEYSPLQTIYFGVGVIELAAVLVIQGLLTPTLRKAKTSTRRVAVAANLDP